MCGWRLTAGFKPGVDFRALGISKEFVLIIVLHKLASNYPTNTTRFSCFRDSFFFSAYNVATFPFRLYLIVCNNIVFKN